MRKINIALSVITVLLLGFVICNSNFMDKLIILEKRYPGYWDYLRPEMTTTVYVTEEDLDNYIISSLKVGWYQGFDIIVNDDGSVFVNGVNENCDVYIRYGRMILPDGFYVLSDGGVSEEQQHIHSYIYDNGETLASLPSDPSFIADSSIHQTYEAGIVIEKGTVIDSKIFYPILSRGEQEVGYFPCENINKSTNCKSIAFIGMDQSVYEEISHKDKKYISDNLKHLYGVDWLTVTFGDGKGVEIIDGNEKYGMLDLWGRVK